MPLISTKVEKQVQTWSLLGPLSILFSLFILVLRDSPSVIDLTVTAVSGLLLSWRWQVKGLAVAMALLATAIVYEVFFNAPGDHIFTLAVSMSVALSFVVTALGGKEIESLLEQKIQHQAEGSSVVADELEKKIQSLQKEMAEKDSATQALLNEKEQMVKSVQAILGGAREELFKTIADKETLHGSLLEERIKTSKLKETIEDLEFRVSEVRNAQALLYQKEDALNMLQIESARQGEEISRLNHKLSVSESQEHLMNNLETSMQAMQIDLSKQVQEVQRLTDALEKAVQRSSHLEIELQTAQTLSRKAESLEATVLSLQTQSEKQLNEIERLAQSSGNVAEFQKALQEKTEALAAASRQTESLNTTVADLQEKIQTLSHASESAVDLQKQLQERAAEIASLNKELAGVKEGLESKEAEAAKYQEMIEELLGKAKDLSDKLVKINGEKEALEKLVASQHQEETMTEEDQTSKPVRALRRAEGMYRQLRDQFEEKSTQLDLARKELFQTQEKLALLEITHKEELVYDQNELLASLEKHILELEDEITELELRLTLSN